MSAWMVSLLNYSWRGCWVIAAVLLLRLGMKRAPKAARCLLWIPVAASLCLPAVLPGIWHFWPGADAVQTAQTEGAPYVLQSGIEALDAPVNRYFASHAVTPDAAAGPDLFAVLGYLWLAGLLALLLWAGIRWLRVRRQVAASIPLQKHVWLCDAIAAPFVFGLFRPQIYLPSGMPAEQRPHVIAHEMAHCRRGDPWWKLLASVFVAVYWFHPLVWVSYRLFGMDLELACDERAVRDLELAQRKDYAQTLLACSTGRPGTGIAFGAGQIKRRVAAVLERSKPRRWLGVVAGIACVVLCIGCLGSASPAAAVPQQVQQMYESRTPYVGSAPAVGQVISAVEFPETATYQQFSLQTDAEPYGVEIAFSVPSAELEGLSQRQEPWLESACQMFALIENAGQIHFVLTSPDGQSARLDYTRDWAESVVGADLWQQSDSPAALQQLLEQIHTHVSSAYAEATAA